MGMQLQVSISTQFQIATIFASFFLFSDFNLQTRLRWNVVRWRYIKSDDFNRWQTPNLIKLLILELKYCEENPKTCLNGGKCTSITKDEGSFECECPSAFKGKRCEIVPIIANVTITSTTSKPQTTSTKLPTTTAAAAVAAVDDGGEDESSSGEQDAGQTTEKGSAESSGGVVEEASVEEIDNEA